MNTSSTSTSRITTLAIASALAVAAVPGDASARNWDWGPAGFTQGWQAQDRLAYVRDYGLADPAVNYFTPWGSGHTESNYWEGGNNTSFQNAFGINHDINSHYGIPLLGYLDIVTPLFNTNQLEIAATVATIWQNVTDVVTGIIDWVTTQFRSDYTTYGSTGSFYYDGWDNGFIMDYGGYGGWGGGPVNGDGCFAAGTPVAMADGTSRPIEQIEVGDQVLAYDVDAGAAVASTVTKTFVHEDWKDRADTVLINGTLRATGNHLFFANGTWRRADQLAVGDVLVHAAAGTKGATETRPRPSALASAAMGLAAAPAATTAPTPADGITKTTVTSIRRMEGLDTVFNLEVADQHDYFTDGVLVHNLYIPCI